MLLEKISDEDYSEIEADLLFALVETALLQGKQIPNKVQLTKYAHSNIEEFGSKKARDCVSVMEKKYSTDLKYTGYFL